jgi:hypothetical protein
MVIDVQLHLDARRRRCFIHCPASDAILRCYFRPAAEIRREENEIAANGDTSDDRYESMGDDKKEARA